VDLPAFTRSQPPCLARISTLTLGHAGRHAGACTGLAVELVIAQDRSGHGPGRRRRDAQNQRDRRIKDVFIMFLLRPDSKSVGLPSGGASTVDVTSVLYSVKMPR